MLSPGAANKVDCIILREFESDTVSAVVCAYWDDYCFVDHRHLPSSSPSSARDFAEIILDIGML